MEKTFIAHSFYAGEQLMTAGTYTISCDHQNREIILANSIGDSVRLPVYGIVMNDECDATHMDFARDGERVVVTHIHLRDEGHIELADVGAHTAEVVNIGAYQHK